MDITTLIDLKNLNEIKIHFASGNNDPKEAKKEFFQGTFKHWQEWQNNKNFERNYILSMVYLKPSEWLFVGVFKKIDVVKKEDGFHYVTELTEIGADLIGRLVIGYSKKYRQSYVLAEKFISELKIIELKREKMEMDEFPGYENICIDYKTLQMIVRIKENSWYTALSNITGIYLITDENNGKHYVGSATGKENFWQRWSDYANSFHGGNVKLKELKNTKDTEYLNNFHYSIIEIYNVHTDKELILERESYWTNVLMSRKYGYN